MSAQQDPAAASAPPLARLAVPLRASPPTRTIEVVAKRFAFEPARIEVTEGERVTLVVKSADGVHGIGIKKFKVDKIVPRGGEPVTIEFVASAAGNFPHSLFRGLRRRPRRHEGMLVVVAK